MIKTNYKKCFGMYRFSRLHNLDKGMDGYIYKDYDLDGFDAI